LGGGVRETPPHHDLHYRLRVTPPPLPSSGGITHWNHWRAGAEERFQGRWGGDTYTYILGGECRAGRRVRKRGPRIQLVVCVTARIGGGRRVPAPWWRRCSSPGRSPGGGPPRPPCGPWSRREERPTRHRGVGYRRGVRRAPCHSDRRRRRRCRRSVPTGRAPAAPTRHRGTHRSTQLDCGTNIILGVAKLVLPSAGGLESKIRNQPKIHKQKQGQL